MARRSRCGSRDASSSSSSASTTRRARPIRRCRSTCSMRPGTRSVRVSTRSVSAFARSSTHRLLRRSFCARGWRWRHVTLSSGRDAAGDACMRVLLNGRSASGTGRRTCDRQLRPSARPDQPEARPSRAGLLEPRTFRQLRAQLAHLRLRLRRPRDRRLELRLPGRQAARHRRSSTPATSPTDHRPSAYVAGHRPSLLRAYSAAGKPVYTQRLYPERPCVYPGAEAACGISSSGPTVIGGVVAAVSRGLSTAVRG